MSSGGMLKSSGEGIIARERVVEILVAGRALHREGTAQKFTSSEPQVSDPGCL